MNGIFSQALTADQTINVTGSFVRADLRFNFYGTYDLSLIPNSLKLLEDDLTVATAAGGRTVNFGVPNQASAARLDLGSSNRLLTVADSDTLKIWNGFREVYGFGSGFTKEGTGTLLLGGDNRFTGTATVAAGTLRLTADARLDAYSVVAVSASAVFDLNGSSQTLYSISGAGSLFLGAGSLTLGADIGMARTASASRLSGAVSGSGSLVKTGTNLAVFTGENSYSGTTTVQGGVLRIGSDAALGQVPASPAAQLFLSGGTLQLGGAFDLNPNRSIVTAGQGTIDTNGFDSVYAGSIAGNGSFSKAGLGTLRFTTAQGYTGGTVVKGGTLLLDATSDPASRLPSQPLTLRQGALAVLGHGGAASLQAFTSLAFGGGAAAVQVVSASGQSATVQLGALTRTAGGTLDFSLPAQGTIETATPNNASGILGGYATVAQATWARNDGAGHIVPFTAYTVNNFDAGLHADLTADQAISTARTAGSLRFQTAAPVALSLSGESMLTIGTPAAPGGILLTSTIGNHPVSIGGGKLTSGTSELLVLQHNVAAPFTISSAIVDNAASVGLTKSGAGSLLLTAGNTYTGPTFISGGTLRLTGAGKLPANTAVTLTGEAALDLNDTTQALGVLSGGPATSIALGGGGLTLTGGGDFAGAITGQGDVVLHGASTILTVSGRHTYQGTTTIRAGQLRVTGDGQLPATTSLVLSGFSGSSLFLDGVSQEIADLSGNGTLAGAGTLAIGSGNGVWSGSVSGPIQLVKDGPGSVTTLDQGGFASITLKRGTIRVANGLGDSRLVFDGGTLQFASTNVFFGSTRAATTRIDAAGGTIDNSAGVVSARGSITGTGRLIKAGLGELFLEENNQFAGGLSVLGGHVHLVKPGSAGTGPIQAANGVTLTANFPLDQAFLNRLNRDTEFVIALGANCSSNLDFSGTSWRLGGGSTGSSDFSGTLTPGGTVYRLGGGGWTYGLGLLTLTRANALTGARSVDIDGGSTGTHSTVNLREANDYTGATTIRNSGLVLSDANPLPNTVSISLSGNANLSLVKGMTLHAGQSLLGDGAVFGEFTVAAGALLAPGSGEAPFGTLRFTGLTLEGALQMDFGGSGGQDLLAIHGDFNVSSGTDSLVLTLAGLVPGPFVIVTYTGILTGRFDEVTLPAGYALDYGSGSNSQITVVPEPGVPLLLLSALPLLRRKRRRSRQPSV